MCQVQGLSCECQCNVFFFLNNNNANGKVTDITGNLRSYTPSMLQ